MKHLSFLIPVGFAAMCFFACKSEPHKVAELSVANAQGRALALFEISDEKGAVFVDSIYPAKRRNNEFIFPCEDMHIYALFAHGSENPLVLLPMPDERLHLHTSYDSLVSDANICDGISAPVNQAVIDYQKRLLQTESLIENTERLWMANRYKVRNADSLHEACSLRINSLLENIHHEAMKLCSRNTNNLIPVFIVNKTVGSHALFNLEDGGDIAFLKACADSMVKHLPGNGHAARFRFNVERAANRLKQRQIFNGTEHEENESHDHR
ncbi:MAG: hypothetical protein NC048_02420 [Bacteroides sp.]|nr:hypothetical protein [Ruminococcus flavefaciens]MCM1554332.1 hypothetical protein [Bacteroides sp.]